MIDDLQACEVMIAEEIDRVSRLPLPEAEKLVDTIRDKGAKLAIPGIVDLSEITLADDMTKIVHESVQDMLLRVSLQMARDDYEDRRTRQQQSIKQAKQQGKYRSRRPNQALHDRVVVLWRFAAAVTASLRRRVWQSAVQARSNGSGLVTTTIRCASQVDDTPMSTAQPLYLERIDADRRMARFYAIRVERTLFGEWAVIYRWGRIGCKGQRREQWVASWGAARAAGERQKTAKLRRGYRLTLTSLP